MVATAAARYLGRALVCLAVGVVVACSDGGGEQCGGEAGTRELSIVSDGIERRALLTVPETALRSGPVPLVLVLHGVLADSTVIQAVTGFPEKAETEGFITVAGDGIGESWNGGVCCEPAVSMGVDDVAFAREIVAAVEAEYCIDRDRVFATGFSNGAAMVFRLFCEASDLFTAFAPVAGSLAQFPCEPEVPRPIEIINNIDDPVVPFTLGEDLSFGQALQWNDCGATGQYERVSANAECRSGQDCADTVSTGFCAVAELGHQWPGGATNPAGPFNATDHIWEFFERALLP